jgi:hypothetical protein
MPASGGRRDDPMGARFLELTPRIVSELTSSKAFLPFRDINIRDPLHRSW